MYIICILDKYIKDKNVGFGDYIAAGEKSIKVDSYRMSIIIIDIPNSPDIIILTNTTYCFIFFVNIILIKHFQLKKIYLDKKYS